MTSEEARKDGWKPVTQSIWRDECVATTGGGMKAWVWCQNEVYRMREQGRMAAIVLDEVDGREMVSVWAIPLKRITAKSRAAQVQVEDESNPARAQRAVQAGIERAMREPVDCYHQALFAIMHVDPRHPCSCVRCRAVVSAELVEQHFVVHEQHVDSVGAPGSTRWCPTHVNVHGTFGMTGLKADGRRKF